MKEFFIFFICIGVIGERYGVWNECNWYKWMKVIIRLNDILTYLNIVVRIINGKWRIWIVEFILFDGMRKDEMVVKVIIIIIV